MVSTDSLRLLVGVGVVGVAVGIGVYALSAKSPLRAPDADPSPAVVRAAVERGVDLSAGTPSANQARLVGVFEEGDTVPFAKATFRNGLYFKDETDEVFSGYLAATHESGTPKLICCVVDGRLQGPSVELYETGVLKRSMRHKDGLIAGQVIEFFEDGSLKLRAMARETTERGGSIVTEITVGDYATGEYVRHDLGTGRMQFIYDNGTVESSNDLIPLDESVGWMLFHDTALSGQQVWTPDSRTIEDPG